ncbi:MAG: DUF488 domain-containing protein [Proteobacteria bacterium]|nr:DUF488 domain-containing protein [Pseudomonadota bacterium]
MIHPLYTIGYEGAVIEAFVLTLLDAGVDTLIDVRDLPLSRKKGYSNAILKETLGVNGIDYVHLRGLGDPKPGREAARAGNMRLFKSIFGRQARGKCLASSCSPTGFSREGVVLRPAQHPSYQSFGIFPDNGLKRGHDRHAVLARDRFASGIHQHDWSWLP